VAVQPKSHLPPCEEKRRLRLVCKEAAERYAEAVDEANHLRGKTSKEQSDRLRAVVNEARNAHNAARLALEQHKQEHGC